MKTAGSRSRPFSPQKPEKNTCCGACYLTKCQKCLCYSCVVLLLLGIAAFALLLLVNAATLETRFVRKVFDTQPVFIHPSEDEVAAQAARFSDGVKINTVSHNITHRETEAFNEMHTYLQEAYPNLHGADFVTKTVVNIHSLLYRVEGSAETPNPYMLCAHLDVVPAGGSTGSHGRSGWEQDPFLGLEGDFVYGRGAIDAKMVVFGIMEALEHLVKTGQRPKRTFYIAFGHDEEVGGIQGAKQISGKVQEMLDSHGEKLDFILDEGLFVMKGIIPATDEPVINIGVVEKGYATFEMEVVGDQQHSSIPPKESVIGILANAVAKLEANPQPSRFGTSVEADMFAYLAPHMSFAYRLVLGNLWLFSDLIVGLIGRSKTTDALQRTTTAVTIIKSGFKVNVIPGRATAFVNHRIHPTDTLESVLQHDKDTVNDWRVHFRVVSYDSPPPVSPYGDDATAFQVIAGSALDIFPDGNIVPGMLVGNTDTLHYLNLTNNIYRFMPAVLDSKDVNRIHGVNERISVENFSKAVEFYHRLMKTSDLFVKSAGEEEEISGSGYSEVEEESEEGSNEDGSAEESVPTSEEEKVEDAMKNFEEEGLLSED